MSERIELIETEVRLRTIATRLPFEFGIARLERLPHCLVRCRARIDDEEVDGLAADHLVPKWFTKRPDQPIDDEIAAMVEIIEHALAIADGTSGDTPFDCWRQVYAAQKDWAHRMEYPPLLWGFGVTFVERSLLDAFCRATDQSFAQAVAAGDLGTAPETVYPELAGDTPATYLPDRPLERIQVRHTIGIDDPLDQRPADAPTDGLPVTLEENIREYGLNRFKIKITGDVRTDYRRIREILRVVDRACDDVAFTIDANEQYTSVGDLQLLIDRCRSDPQLAERWRDLLFVEQPFPREFALSRQVGDALAAWPDAPPMIIDESDANLDSLGVALKRGYAGTSHKNCKGVFESLINACLRGRRREEEIEVLLSGEDLSTIGPVSLQQDLAVMAALGIPHVERNGHHYFRGLSMFEEATQTRVREAHEDLYRTHPNGFVTLDINHGRVDLGSANTAPFGYADRLDVEQFTPHEHWTFEASDA